MLMFFRWGKTRKTKPLNMPLQHQLKPGSPNVLYRLSSGVKRASIMLKLIKWRYIIILTIAWSCLVHYYERTVVKRAVKKCMWNKWENSEWPKDAAHRMALFADPQIMDKHSYPGRPAVVNYFTQQLLDNYHARNYKYVAYYLDPDSTIFLGDLFDGGRYWDDDYWMEEYKRFNQLFPKKPLRTTIMSIPGNHDIGFGDTIIPEALERFRLYFGETSAEWILGNHSIVLLDTISLSNAAESEISRPSREFLDNLKDTDMPRIMMSHVPLWRDNTKQQCGPLRESHEKFPIWKGDQYQTVITYDLSQQILNKVKPSLLFSGDDHDYCFVEHQYNDNKALAQEITVKSCAMNMGISKPAIQLLSLYNPMDGQNNGETFKTEICYMPCPYKPLKMYTLMLVISMGFIGFMFLLPKRFNVLVGSRLATEQMHSKKFDLPVTNKWEPTTGSTTDPYLVGEQRNVAGAIINSLTLLACVFAVFVVYYKNF